MVFPLVPLAIGGLMMSGLANGYREFNNGNAYRQFAHGYKALDRGYRDYLARNGRKINPNRAIISYYGQYLRSRTQAANSYMGVLGSAGGSFGAGAMLTSRYMGTSKWL